MQTKEDLDFLYHEVRRIITDITERMPTHIRLHVEKELEDFGCKFIYDHALNRNEVGYLAKCMLNEKKTILRRRAKYIQRFNEIKEDPTFDPGLSIDTFTGDDVLDRLYRSAITLRPRHIEAIYWFILVVTKGSVRPVFDTSDYMGVERHTIQKILYDWKEAYAKEIRREVRKVRSLDHLRQLLYAERRRINPENVDYHALAGVDSGHIHKYKLLTSKGNPKEILY